MIISTSPVFSDFIMGYPYPFCMALFGLSPDDIEEINTTGTITIPSYVQMIHTRAFEGTNLKSIIIPKSVFWIKKDAFKDCKKLESVIIESESNLNSCESDAFSGCTNIKEFYVPENKQNLFKNLKRQ